MSIHQSAQYIKQLSIQISCLYRLKINCVSWRPVLLVIGPLYLYIWLYKKYWNIVTFLSFWSSLLLSFSITISYSMSRKLSDTGREMCWSKSPNWLIWIRHMGEWTGKMTQICINNLYLINLIIFIFCICLQPSHSASVRFKLVTEKNLLPSNISPTSIQEEGTISEPSSL